MCTSYECAEPLVDGGDEQSAREELFGTLMELGRWADVEALVTHTPISEWYPGGGDASTALR